MTGRLRTPWRRVAAVTPAIVVALLLWVYFQDIVGNGLNPGTWWCIEHYGFPANFDYIAHTGAERIWSGVADWWSWTRPGMTCRFTDVVTKASVEVRPPASRSVAAAVLWLALAGATAVLIVLRRTRRS
ncbi:MULTISPECIES: hypothetical protein [Nocardiaceae]|uniref:Uncharacterized protein n=1 Tax=Rhodococcoides kroppenstedtii TaxID=293050 RepID=A0ABS7NVL6_9NOCA|nr:MULTISPECIES: hypothetical protein [Rhodococcus]MBY6314383.1 hypothetical protein [Rhodococcus kroppenstedtii]MBY6322079.1 hypothetical protein [Rhodococcus kroppenstedtii]MBY6400967.1 hypothetical protein [Rhodococcus kroppenstedtii]